MNGWNKIKSSSDFESVAGVPLGVFFSTGKFSLVKSSSANCFPELILNSGVKCLGGMLHSAIEYDVEISFASLILE